MTSSEPVLHFVFHLNFPKNKKKLFSGSVSPLGSIVDRDRPIVSRGGRRRPPSPMLLIDSRPSERRSCS